MKFTSYIQKITFAIVGSGFRSNFYLHIAQLLPQYFQVCGVITRTEEKGIEIEKQWGVRTYRNIETLLMDSTPDFVVVSVAREAAPDIITELARKSIPVLAETPPAPDLERLIEVNKLVKQGCKIQVAEQYHLQPINEARIGIANSGKLGAVSEAQISISNDHHGMSLLRRSLGIKFENATIKAFEFEAQIIAGPTRKGPPEEETLINAKQVIAYIDFGNKLGLYDFTKDQHRSWIRSERFLIRGSKGEIKDHKVKYLKDFITPIEYELTRQSAGEYGNLEGYYLRGILAGEEWVYKNPFAPGRLSDEEIAIAMCLKKMRNYIDTGVDFYSLAEASQDMYLSLMIQKSIDTKESIVTESQPWSCS